MVKLIMLNYEPLKNGGKKNLTEDEEKEKRTTGTKRKTGSGNFPDFWVLICHHSLCMNAEPSFHFVLRHRFLHVIFLCTLHVSPDNTTTVIYICVYVFLAFRLGN